jgi:hypothetical protein
MLDLLPEYHCVCLSENNANADQLYRQLGLRKLGYQADDTELKCAKCSQPLLPLKNGGLDFYHVDLNCIKEYILSFYENDGKGIDFNIIASDYPQFIKEKLCRLLHSVKRNEVSKSLGDRADIIDILYTQMVFQPHLFVRATLCSEIDVMRSDYTAEYPDRMTGDMDFSLDYPHREDTEDFVRYMKEKMNYAE